MIDLHRQHRTARCLRHFHAAFEPRPGRGRAIPVADDALLDHRNVLLQQPGILGLRTPLLFFDLAAQFLFALLLRAGIVGGLAALGLFLLLAFDLCDAFTFRFGLALPLGVGLRFTLGLRLGLALGFLPFADLLLLCLLSLLLLLALLQLLLTLLLRALFRLASLLLPALLGLLLLAFLHTLALLLTCRAVEDRTVDDDSLDRERRLQRLAPDRDHREAEDAGEHDVQEQCPDEISPVFL